MPKTIFIAYSNNPADIGNTIEESARQLATSEVYKVKTWRQMSIPGHFLATEVRAEIDGNDVFAADISVLNFNVYYEIGFAIGRGKPILLIRNKAVAKPEKEKGLALLDALGYVEYENSGDLSRAILGTEPGNPLRVASEEIKQNAPAFLLESQVKSDNLIRIRSRIKKARIQFRSFDPTETPRLSALHAIQEVAKSIGIASLLLPSHHEGHEIHNLRAAFIAGLANGLDRPLLLLQEGEGDPVPLDYRDLVFQFTFPEEINEAVAWLAGQITERLQGRVRLYHADRRDRLSQIRLGATAAENELQDLGDYYLETDAFLRAFRGDARLVVGRKGSGKTALFAQLRDRIRQTKSNVVLDLKPEGYKLRKFKEDVLQLLGEGTFEHTVTALWEYLLLLEVCYKLLEKDRVLHTRDQQLFKPYRELSDAYAEDELIREGDFSERLSLLLNRIMEEYQSKYGSQPDRRLSTAEITELIYRHDIHRLRAAVERYLKFKDSLWILFDNLDKGWPTHGLEPYDLVVLRTLLDATRKIQNDLQGRGLPTHSIVFLRRDVYELLVEETPDRGKEARAAVDWTEPDLLREMLRRRLAVNDLPGDQAFDPLWAQVCVRFIEGEETSGFLIDRCLMRPRSLLALLEKCWGSAVNLGHTLIQEEDLLRGLREYSAELVYEIGLEIRDVFPEGENTLYCLIGCKSRLSEGSIAELLSDLGETVDQEKVVHLLLWFGVLGITDGDEDVQFIWDYEYDERRMVAWTKKWKQAGRLQFEINRAFWPALGIQE